MGNRDQLGWRGDQGAIRQLSECPEAVLGLEERVGDPDAARSDSQRASDQADLFVVRDEYDPSSCSGRKISELINFMQI